MNKKTVSLNIDNIICKTIERKYLKSKPKKISSN